MQLVHRLDAAEAILDVVNLLGALEATVMLNLPRNVPQMRYNRRFQLLVLRMISAASDAVNATTYP